MKNFIKKLELRRSDLMLLIGFIPFAIFLIFGQLFMQFPNPNDVALPLWAGIICFVVMVVCWGYYLYLEVYNSKEKYNLIVASIFLFLLLLNVIAILVQPKYVSENVVIRYVTEEMDPSLVGTTETVVTPVSDIHKFMFIGELVGTITFIYIGLFVFPKRFKSLVFVKYLGYALFAFLGVLILYGYIKDFHQYVAFFKHILNIDRTDPDIYHKTVTSFIIHRNAYGMCMMLGIIFAFINHSLENKRIYYFLAAFFYINMIFSLCKTGLLISILVILIYVIYRLVKTYKEHTKRNKTIFIIGGALIVVLGGAAAISYLTKGKFLGPIYNVISNLTGGGSTLDFRNYIWDNSYQLLQNGWWLIGRGFGTYNLLLKPMNWVSHHDEAFPAHSAYVCLVAEGGILYLLAYLVLLGYTAYVIYKCFKKNPGLAISFSLGILSFVLYSFIEAIQYLVYIFIFPMMVLYNSLYKEEKAE